MYKPYSDPDPVAGTLTVLSLLAAGILAMLIGLLILFLPILRAIATDLFT